MPDVIWYAISLLSGWALCAFAIRATRLGQNKISDSFYLMSKNVLILVLNGSRENRDPNPEWINVLLAVILSCGGVALLVLAFGESIDKTWAFKGESHLLSRLSRTAVFIVLGFTVRAYKDIVALNTSTFLRLIFDSEHSSAVSQASFVLALGFLLLLLLDPSFVGRITSFKAGEVEAHFKVDSSEIRPNITLINVRRAVTLNVWRNFQLIDNFPNNAWRQLSYKLSRESNDRIDFAQSVIHRQLAGLFDLGSCFQSQGQINLLHDDADIRAFVQEYIILVKVSSENQYNSDDKIDIATKEDLHRLYYQSLSIQRKLFFKLIKNPLIPNCINDYHLFPEDPDQFKISLKSKTLGSMWEPYTISAISDFVAFVYGDKDKADFLDSFLTSVAGRKKLCADECEYFVPIGLSSFYWYVVRAKIDSEDAWPTKELVENIHSMIDWVDQYLYADDGHIVETLNKNWRPVTVSEVVDLKRHYRKIKLQDLSLGLELFYRKALSGEKLSLLQQDYWRSWLTEVLSILFATEDVGLHSNMDEKDIVEWRNTKSIIESVDYSTLFDASSAAALGLVLLPQQSGTPSAQDCLLAKEVAAYGKEVGSRLTQAMENNHATRANIERFSEEITEHVYSACQ